jgi:hypothetical protein
MTRQARLDALTQAAAHHALWELGIGSEWECGAIVSPNFLADLITLASHAPTDEVKTFLSTHTESKA